MRWLVLLSLTACTVDRKSETLVCATVADCKADNSACVNGYCVKQSQSDCPDHCDACNTNDSPHTCTVTDTGGASFDCPSGFTCLVTCGGPGTKCGQVTCHDKSACIISCEGASSCGDIHCNDACACDVTCTSGACAGNDISCPHDGNTYCTPDQTDGPACVSAPGGRCNSC